jgi:hypothetical protein
MNEKGRRPGWIAVDWPTPAKRTSSIPSHGVTLGSPPRSPERSRRRVANDHVGNEHEPSVLLKGIDCATPCMIVKNVADCPRQPHRGTSWNSELLWERNFLLQTIRGGADPLGWGVVTKRILEFPKVLEPILLDVGSHRGKLRSPREMHVAEDHDRGKPTVVRTLDFNLCHEPATVLENTAIYEETILGALCSSNDSEAWKRDDASGATLVDVIHTVLDLHPGLVKCSHRFPGHIPLRDAVFNSAIPPMILELLVQADPLSVHVTDRDGLTPLDHLLRQVHLGHSDMSCVKSLLRHAAREVASSYQRKSPLLTFLSSGTAHSPYVVGKSLESLRLNRMLDCVRLLLQWNPALIAVNSLVSGCTPLHVAVRNYGSFSPLLYELMELDPQGCLMRHRNRFGDLVLHVACSVGVPIDTLRMMLARTSLSIPCDANDTPHPLIWSRNSSGYTPVDLEWIRHIEAGDGFFSHRSFYPLDERGIRRPGGRCDALYDVLLRQAVDQVFESFTTEELKESKVVSLASYSKSLTEPGTRVDDRIVGLLLHRIMLIMSAATLHDLSQNPPDADILHQAAALCGPHGPALPGPLLDLVKEVFSEQMSQADHAGKLPLHYAVELRRQRECASEKSLQEWTSWVSSLIAMHPDACRVKDHRGRLPLHQALYYFEGDKTCANAPQIQEARNIIVQKIAGEFPLSVEMVDTSTGFTPFLLAALNPLISTETVYYMLRMCPSMIGQ